ncbi:hypothetical protein ACFC0D_37890, partial [Streptomyces sp. NPDC056222]
VRRVGRSGAGSRGARQCRQAGGVDGLRVRCAANYVPGVSGWHLDQNGSAEFNDITIRGGTSLGGEAFYYDGTPGPGTLVLAIAAAAGTDPYGNAYEDGVTVLGSTGTVNINTDTGVVWSNNLGSLIEIIAGGAQALQQLRPATVPGVTWADAALGTNLTSTHGADTPSLFLQSPSTTVNTAKSSIRLHGGSPTVNANRIEAVTQVFEITGSVTAANLQGGQASTAAPGAGGGVTSVNVVFPTPFPSTPAVTIDPRSAADPSGTVIRGYVDSVTTTGFTIRAYRSTNALTNWSWIAYA